MVGVYLSLRESRTARLGDLIPRVCGQKPVPRGRSRREVTAFRRVPGAGHGPIQRRLLQPDDYEEHRKDRFGLALSV